MGMLDNFGLKVVGTLVGLEILDQYFQQGQDLASIRRSLENDNLKSALGEMEISNAEFIDEINSDPDVEDINGFIFFDGRTDEMHRRSSSNTSLTNRAKFRAAYEKMRQEAAKVGLNAAAYMPRLINGDIVGSPDMIEDAMQNLQCDIISRKIDAISNPALAVRWMLKNMIRYSAKAENTGVERRTESNNAPAHDTHDEEFDCAVKSLMKLGFREKEAQNRIEEFMRENPDITKADDVVFQIMKNQNWSK